MSIGLFYGAGKELNIIPRSFKLSQEGLLIFESDSCFIALKYYDKTNVTLLLSSLNTLTRGILSALIANIFDFL